MRFGIAVALLVVAACGDDGPSGTCTDGETRACYTGPDGSEGVGTCAAGLETCANGQFPGICIGDITPFVDNCNGLDDDCNGVVDDAAGTGNPCNNAEDCAGTTACVGDSIRCVGPDRNACGLCGGDNINGLGTACVVANCAGELICNEAGDATTCDAPAENACGLCGGPALVGLDEDCTASSGCAGLGVCNEDGDAVSCDCNPQPGMCRAGGVFRNVVAPQVGDLVITEVMPSPSGDQTKREWFEVLVLADVDLNQLGLDRASDSSEPDLVESVDCLSVTAGTRLVFARSAVVADNGGLPPVAGTFSFALLAGSVANPGDVQLVANGTVIDAVSWTASTSGTALQLDPDSSTAAANDDPATFCAARSSYGDGDLGTPGDPNAECVGANECLDNGVIRAATVPIVGDLVITEVMPSPSGDDAVQEWIEVEVKADVDLNNLALDRAADSSAPDVLTSLDCLPVSAGTRLVFAASADPAVNGGLPAVFGTFSFALVGGSVVSPGDVQLLVNGTLLDAVSWTSSRTAKALQVDLGAIDPALNDLATNLCDATTSYNGGADLGTPGLANAVCPPQPGECLGADGLRRAIDKPVGDQLVITEVMIDPATPGDATAEWFEITNIASDPFDLNDLGLQGATTTVNTISDPVCRPVLPGGFAVFGRTANTTDNGGVVVDGLFTFSLANTNSTVSVLSDGVAIDTVTWATEPVAGRSRQLLPAQTTTVGNDSQTSFCNTFDGAANDIDGAGPGINFGTPGRANPSDCTANPP